MVNRKSASFYALALLLALCAAEGSDFARLRDRAWSVIVDALKNGPPEDRDFATSMLDRTGDPRARGLLLDALFSPHSTTRAEAAKAFRKRHDAAMVEALASALRRESDPWVKMLLVEGIAGSGSPTAMEVIGPVLRDPNMIVRSGAFAQLERLGKSATALLIAELSAPDEDNRVAAAIALGRVGDKSAVQALRMASKDASTRVRTEAALALAAIVGSSSRPQLESLLASEAGVARLRVASTLSRLGDPRGNQIILELLRDGDPATRAQGASLARGSLSPDVQRALLALREHDPAPKVRTAAMETLVKERGNTADDVLHAALKDPDEWVRLQAARQLLMYEDRSGTQVLKAALTSVDPEIRVAATEVAADFLRPNEAYLLRGALSDENPHVMMNAIRAAARLHADSLLPEIQHAFEREHPDVVAVAAAAIADLAAANAASIFEDALAFPRAPCRIAAAAELVRMLPAVSPAPLPER
jgi:HEAT repeat protein